MVKKFNYFRLYKRLRMMKHTLFMLVLVFAFSWGNAQSQSKVFEPGALWLDTDGTHINAHGGGLLYDQGFYYWYGEHKDQNSLAQVGVNVYKSKDLYSWQKMGVALAVSDDPNSEITAGCVIERPKVIYNKKTKKYVMWFHLELKGMGYAAAKTAVAISDTPVGPFKYVQSYNPNKGKWPMNFQDDWKTAYTEDPSLEWWTDPWYKEVKEGMFVKRDFVKGQMARDMTLFVDDDNKGYHIYSSEENLTLHIAELSDDYLGFTGKYITIAPAGHNEAPTMFKRNGSYYMITSGCTGWDPNAARSFKAKSIWGPWEPLGNPCIGEGADLTFSSQSTYVLKVEGTSDQYIFMADRWNPKNHIDGRYVWLPIQWDGDKPVLEWKDSWSLDE